VYQNHIHNLNLFIAEFMIKVGLETKNQKWIDLGTYATNYSISNQLPNGAFDYNGPPEKPKNYVDNYHTGFVLRMLHSIWLMTANKEIYSSLDKCFNHYTEHFFEDMTIPKLLPDRKYRIDIHSCAESINCLTEISKSFPDALRIAENVANWTVNNLQDKTGYFYYGILKSRFTRRTYISKIPYIRWGQAWMLKSLSNLLKYI
jgi:rhamnogalacturonyl hydrolase YesR